MINFIVYLFFRQIAMAAYLLPLRIFQQESIAHRRISRLTIADSEVIHLTQAIWVMMLEP